MQSDGSAIGTGGSRLTADRFDESVDRAAERIAAAQKLKATGPVQPGKAGDLIARVYTYTRPAAAARATRSPSAGTPSTRSPASGIPRTPRS